jgi:hypothetical protein
LAFFLRAILSALTDFPLAVGDGAKHDQSIFCCVTHEEVRAVS